MSGVPRGINIKRHRYGASTGSQKNYLNENLFC